jgi:hypothetical protein
MVIEYIAEGNQAPMVLIYGRDWEQCQTLCDTCGNLAEGRVKRAALHSLPGFECVSNCQLWAKVGDADRGIDVQQSGNVFECVLTAKNWARMAELLQPLCRPQPEETDIFHQLDRSGAVALLAATAREW